eukprot:jgi/Mesen1/7814/ME000413S07069
MSQWMEKATGMFKPKPTPQQQLREWQRKLRNEVRNLDRQMREIQREEASVKKEVKDAAKRNDMQSARVCPLFDILPPNTFSSLLTATSVNNCRQTRAPYT